MLSNKKFRLISIIGLLFLSGLACQFSIGDVEGGEADITNITVCKSVDGDQKCEGQADLFEATEKVYTSVQVANLSAEDRVAARWFKGTEQITVGEQDEFVVSNQAGGGHISFFLEPDTPFPSGDYSVQVFLNDSLIQTGNFQIEGAEPAAAEDAVAEPPAVENAIAEPPAVENTAEDVLTPTEDVVVVQSITTCFTINDNSQCQDQSTTFGPTDIIHASVEVVDALAGTIITAYWLQGEDLFAETTYPLEGGGSGFIDFTLNPDKPFPAGPYALEIYQGEMLVDRIDLLVQDDESVLETQTAAGWQTFDSDMWQISLDYPANWGVEDTEDNLAFFGTGKTLFYLIGYVAEGSAEEENQKAAQSALDYLTAQFDDFQSTDLEPFSLNDLPGLTSDYAYTDADGDYLNGSVIVTSSNSGNTYTIYLEALTDDYGTALDDFNGILQSLRFK